MKAFLKDGIFIPMRLVTEDHMEDVRARYERHVYGKEEVCERCEYYSERPCDVCSGCPNYKGLFKLHSQSSLKLGGVIRPMLRLPYGDRVGVKKIFGDDEGNIRIIDKTPEVPMVRSFKMVQGLRDYQKPPVQKMLKTRSGILKSPPRSGKTVMGAAYIAEQGLKTLILAGQHDWLENFMETFIGSDTQPAMTTINKKRIGFCKKFEDFQRCDVAMATYQSFISENGKKLLKRIKNMFSVIIVDEVQGAAALEFSRIVGSFNARYKFGLSGTPERKDTLESIIYKVFGKIFYEVKVERLRPRIQVVTPPFVGKLPQNWTYAVGTLEKHPQRLKQIAEEAVKDVRDGHVVFIPLARIPVVKALTKAINMLAGQTIAAEFHGGTKKDVRKDIIDKARNRKIKVLVGNSRLLSTGINIPTASMLYQVSPSSNIPKADQRFSRILTPCEGKPQPTIKYWLDDIDLIRSCMRNEHFGCVVPRFKPMIDPRTRARLDDYFRNKKRKDDNERFGYI